LLHSLLSYYNMHFKYTVFTFFTCINVMGPMLRCD
jgi:hypothetical protein